MWRNRFLQWLRQIRLMHGFDLLYFAFNKIRFYPKNRKFIRQHPGITLPPDYMLYEAYRLDYADYIGDGNNTAHWIHQQLKEYIHQTGNLLEWGCGPARIIRHLPFILPSYSIFGTDYNRKTIAWCRQHIKNVQFSNNDLLPPLPFQSQFFDAVYALSVLTHLSAANHETWINELGRVLKSGGVLLVTTQGKAFLEKLTPEERVQFENGLLVERGKVTEGHRSYSAFQPESCMRQIFSLHWKVLQFIPGTSQSWGPEQDTWIVRKA